MVSVKNIQGLSNGNSIQGEFPSLKNSEINFRGENNILYCEPGVVLTNSKIDFNADNAVVYLGTNRYEYKFAVSLHNDTVFHMGRHNYINQEMKVFLSEQRHCIIGDSGNISWGLSIRNSDPHLIYSCKTKQRVNPTCSVYIGDHVWIGQDSLILKGTHIDSGSIIAANAVIAGKHIPNNTVWAGNPARQIKEDVFWDNACVHAWKENMTAIADSYDSFNEKCNKDHNTDRWIYNYCKEESLDYDDIDQSLNNLKGSQEKCDFLIRMNNTKSKNRFVHKI